MAPQALTRAGEELSTIRSEMLDIEQRFVSVLDGLPEPRRWSARNLVHYLALRRRDLRPLQSQLAACGLSSLGCAESQALQNVQAVLDMVARIGADEPADVTCPDEGPHLLQDQTLALFGPPPAGRDVRIMVTMPSDAAHDYVLVRDLVAAGMDCMRINCAHDDRDVWSGILRHLARANQETGRSCPRSG